MNDDSDSDIEDLAMDTEALFSQLKAATASASVSRLIKRKPDKVNGEPAAKRVKEDNPYVVPAPPAGAAPVPHAGAAPVIHAPPLTVLSFYSGSADLEMRYLSNFQVMESIDEKKDSRPLISVDGIQLVHRTTRKVITVIRSDDKFETMEDAWGYIKLVVSGKAEKANAFAIGGNRMLIATAFGSKPLKTEKGKRNNKVAEKGALIKSAHGKGAFKKLGWILPNYWDDVQLSVMTQLLERRYAADAKFKAILAQRVRPANVYLVHFGRMPKFWDGQASAERGGLYRGRNMLGVLMMELARQLMMELARQ